MGMQLLCKNTGKNCGYTTWFEQRVEIILVTIKYLEKKILEIEKKINNTDEDKREEIYFIDGKRYDFYSIMTYITRLKTNIIKPIKNTKNKQLIFNIIEMDNTCKEGLTYFDVYGIHLLCKQSDCDGLYTVGEAFDIVLLLETIEPDFDKDSDIYETVYTIKSEFSSPIIDIFKDSITSRHPVLVQ